MNTILSLDTKLFHLINSGLDSRPLDVLMPFITRDSNFNLVIIVLIIIILIRSKDRRGTLKSLVLLVLLVFVSDFLSTALKGLFLRTRPCHTLDTARLLVGCSGSYSFPSGHATNIFAAMVFLSTRNKRYTAGLLVIAVSVAYSRVYVGVHYPTDVVFGALLGSACALVFAQADRRWGPAFIDYVRNRRGSLEL